MFIRRNAAHETEQVLFWEGLRNGRYGKVIPLPYCHDIENPEKINVESALIACPLDGCEFSSCGIHLDEAWNAFVNTLKVC